MEQTPSPLVVVGFDNSDGSVEALNWAVDYAKTVNGRLKVVMAWDWPKTAGWYVSDPSIYEPGVSTEVLLEKTIQHLHEEAPGLLIESLLAEGPASKVLIDASRDASVLVVGSRGHGEFAGMLLGSVGQHCSTHAHCPVVIVRSH